MTKFGKTTMAALFGLAVIAGCDGDKKPTAGGAGGGGNTGSGTQSAAGADAIPASLVVPAAPDGAQDVSAAKKAAAKDQEVVIRGIVAGSVDPIAANRAVFTLADPSLETCDKDAGDSCKTPWDACCAEPASIVAKSLTVQVVGADGRPLKAGLKGVGGLAPMKVVTVKGKVRSVEGEGDKKVITVDATAIHVKP
ncbi:MAG TPA: hypothetical protein VEA69_15460 [Tepidisphaeraceae bacterium]|nr:hypothetical protein [Tepidisphaeraceae bacterium]